MSYRVIPLPDYPVPIDGDRRPLLFARPLHSVHTFITGCGGGRFT
jgi:hypothetical protein